MKSRTLLSLFSISIFLLLYSSSLRAQVFDGNAEWAWMSGDNTNLDRGWSGAQVGVPNVNARPPSRWQATTWTGNDGNLWLFGGEYNNGANGAIRGNPMNDLWKYDITTELWTWMGGPFSATTNAGFGDPGVYGPMGTPGANYNPRSRRGATSWKDASGLFWLFAGWSRDQALNTGYLNDLWNYNPVTGNWTWVSGSNTFVTHGTYGTKGVAAATNQPGGRGGGLYNGGNPASWVDANGDFWIFGGLGYAATGPEGVLNDLWKFSPTTGMWTWVSGSDQVNQQSVFGTMGVAAAANVPAGRYGPICWSANGLFYLFGGRSIDAGGNWVLLNDLWTYNPVTNMWTWINGSNLPNQAGNYGTMGTAAATNQPGARTSQGQPHAFTDNFGKFWLYGGYGFGTTGSAESYLSDLWQYDPSTNMWTFMKGQDPTLNPHFAVRGTQKVRAATNFPASKYGHCTWTDLNGNFWLLGGITRHLQGIYPDRPTNDLWRLDQVAVPPPPPVYVTAPPHVCVGDTGVLYQVRPIPNATSYEWVYTGTGVTLRDGATTTAPSNRLDFAPNATSGLLQVRSVNIYGTSAYTDTLITINPIPVVDLGRDIDTCGLITLTLNAGNFSNAKYLWSNGETTPSVTVDDSATYWVNVDINGCTGSDTVNIRIVPVSAELGSDTIICDYNLPLTLSTVQHPTANILWSNGLSANQMTIDRSGKYWLEVSFKNCVMSDTINVEVIKSPDIFIGADTTICEQFPLTIGAEVQGYMHTWSTGATTPFIDVAASGTYILEASYKGCSVFDTIEIIALPRPPVNLGEDRDICEEQTMTLDASVPGGVTYEWNTGESTPSIIVDEQGFYTVKVITVNGCIGYDSVLLSTYPNPIVMLPKDTVVCVESPLVIKPRTINTDYLLWSDGSSGSTLTVAYEGIYTVTAVNKCSTDVDTIVIDPIYCNIWLPNAFTPNNDGRNEVFKVRGNLGQVSRFGLSIYNRWGERIFHTLDKTEGWDGTFKGQPAALSTYTYHLEYELTGKSYELKGTFELIR